MYLLFIAILLGAAPTGARELLWREDFEQQAEVPLMTWTTVGGKWEVATEGTHVLRQSQENLGGNAIAVLTWRNYTVQAAVRCPEHARTWGVGLVAYWRDRKNHYRLVQVTDRLALLRVAEGQVEPIALRANPMVPDQWAYFQLRAETRPEGVWVGGKVWPLGEREPETWLLTAQDWDPPASGGPAGVWTGKAAAQFKEFAVRLGAPGRGTYRAVFKAWPGQRLPADWWAWGGQWKVKPAEPTLQQTAVRSGLDFDGNAFALSFGWSNYTVQARLKFLRGRPPWGMGLIGYWQGEGYHYRLHTVGDKLFLTKQTGREGQTTHLQAVQLKLQPGRWYVFRLRLETRRDATYLRGKVWPVNQPEPAEWTVEATDAEVGRLRRGSVGFWVLKGACSCDDLIVRQNESP